MGNTNPAVLLGGRTSSLSAISTKWDRRLTIFTAGRLPVMTASCEGDAGALVGDIGVRLLRGEFSPVALMGHHVVRYLFNLTRYSFTRQLSKAMLCVASAFTARLPGIICPAKARGGLSIAQAT